MLPRSPSQDFNKLFTDNFHAPLQLIVDYESRAMSHKIGPEGFRPTILALGAQRRHAIVN